MKRKLVLLTLLIMTWVGLSAQRIEWPEGTFGMDKAKKIIVVTGKENATETCVVEGETYRLYRTTLPVINITTDG